MANHSVIQRINIMVAWKASVSARLLASAIKLQHTEMASAGARSVMNFCKLQGQILYPEVVARLKNR